MTTKNTAVLTAFLTVVLVVLGGAAALKGGLYVAKHEGDTLHLMQIVFRMADGQVPHLDFMTPIGVLAFWPIAMLVKAGFGIGMAVIWAQVLTAAVFLPLVVWVASTRLKPWLAGLFGLIVLVLLLALIHGEAQRAVSISMHYNRLAWAAAFVAILAAVIPPARSGTGVVDGLLIGAMVSAMALIKMTYFVAFAPPILIALLLTKQNRACVVATITGGAVIVAVTLIAGVDFWLAYAGDLLTVARSEVRPAPGEPLSAVMGAPAYLAGSMTLLIGVVFLRQAGVPTGGLVLLLLAPGFFYVTYQNYGNDPQWLMLLGVLLLALRGDAAEVVNRFGWNLRDAIGLAGMAALVLSLASFFNLAFSPLRHLYVDAEKYAPLLPDGGIHADLMAVDARVNRVDARVTLDGEVAGIARYPDRGDKAEFLGEPIPTCTVELGLPLYMGTIARDLEEAGLAEGNSMFAADVFSSYWLFSALEPLDQGAPWYYGGLPGLEDADYLLVPLCPVVVGVQKRILEDVTARIEDGSLQVQELRRTDLYRLYSVN